MQVLNIIFRIVTYLGDSVVCLFSVAWILTGLYGCGEKKRKGKLVFAISAAVLNATILMMEYLGAIGGGMSGADAEVVLSGSGPLPVALLVYWMFALAERKRIKRFFIILFALELYYGLFNMFGCLVNFVAGMFPMNRPLSFLVVFSRQVLTFLLVFFLSKLSTRNRKEPMRFSMMLATFIMGVFLDSFLNLFLTDDYEKSDPVMMLGMAVGAEMGDRILSGILLFLIIFSVLAFLVFLIRDSEAAYFQKKNTLNEYYLEAQKAHYESLIESDREVRKVKHDMANHIYVLQQLSESGKHGEVAEYLAQLGENLSRSDKKLSVGNEIADAILADKMRAAEEIGAAITVDGTMAGMDLKAVDVCTILANILDNAIEAVRQLPEGRRIISLTFRKNNNYFLLTQQNQFAKEVKVADGVIESTKKKDGSHGYGIMNIREAAERYDGECVLHVPREPDEDGFYSFQMEVILPIGDT